MATSLVFPLLVSSLLFGCATFRIPAPKGPSKTMVEPAAESSTINVPINISMTALSDKLDQFLSKSKALNKLNQEKNVAGKIQDFLNGQTGTFDANLLNNIYLRMVIGKAWDALQNPIRLNYDLSLLLNLQTVRISPPMRKGDISKVVVGLVAKPKLVSGDIPTTSPQSSPTFTIIQEVPENGFHIALDNELSFDFIGKELTKKLGGTAYHLDNRNIVVDRITVYGSSDLAVIKVQVRGTAKGTIYLTGVPAYDESSTTLSVSNLEYTVETKNVLAKAAAWLLHTGLRNELADQARWFIGDKVDAMKDRLSDALNRKVNRYVSMSGKINRMRPVAVGLTNTSLKAVLVADGKVELSVF
jgi:hypothetical protein